MTKVTAAACSQWRRRRGAASRACACSACCCATTTATWWKTPSGTCVSRAIDLVVWDHGSTDETPDVLRGLQAELVELQTIPRSVDFYGLYQAMSEHLLENYVGQLRLGLLAGPGRVPGGAGPGPPLPGMARRRGRRRHMTGSSSTISISGGPGRRRPGRPGGRAGPPLQPFPDCGPRIRCVAGLGDQHQGVQPQPSPWRALPAAVQPAALPDEERGPDGGAGWRWTGPGCAGAGAITTTTT